MPIKISLGLDDLVQNKGSEAGLFQLLPKIVVDSLGSLNNLDEFALTYKISDSIKLRFKLQEEETADGEKKMVLSAEAPISVLSQPKIVEWIRSQRERILSKLFQKKD